MACINSLKKNYPNHPTLLVCYTGKKKNVFSYLKNIPNLIIIPPRDIVKNNNISNLGVVKSSLVYQRYRLWSDEFIEYDKILHLDADMIILKPLDEIFQREDFLIIKDNFLQSNFNIFFSASDQEIYLKKLLQTDKIPYPIGNQFMGNAGLFMIPAKYRNQKNFNELIEITRRYENFLGFADQSVISIWCFKHHIPLNKCIYYNFQSIFLTYKPLTFQKEDILQKSFVLHFSHIKPDMPEFVHWLGTWGSLLKSIYDVYFFQTQTSIFNKIHYFFFRICRINRYYFERYIK